MTKGTISGFVEWALIGAILKAAARAEWATVWLVGAPVLIFVDAWARGGWRVPSGSASWSQTQRTPVQRTTKLVSIFANGQLKVRLSLETEVGAFARSRRAIRTMRRHS